MTKELFLGIAMNNFRAIIIHILLCIISWIPITLIWEFGVRNAFVHGGLGMKMIGIFTTITLLLYFVLGKKFLRSTNKILTDMFSVIVIPIVIVLAMLIAWPGYGGLLTISIHPISETITFYFGLEQQHSNKIVSAFPSIAMWLGLFIKR
jgi:hypothetical protein